MSNKRVHEIAKERGLPTKDVLARLKAAGVDVKASSSSVDEEVASRVLANGAQAAPATSDKPAKAPAQPEGEAAEKPKGRSADGKSAPQPAARTKAEAQKPAETPKAAAKPKAPAAEST